MRPKAWTDSSSPIARPVNAEIMQIDRPNQCSQNDHEDCVPGAVGETEIDRVADADDDEDRDQHAAGVSDQAARQDGRPGHRHRAEPVDDALLEFLGERDGRAEGGERGRLGDDAGHQEVHIVDVARHADRAAEDVAEQQHEHDRLDHGEHQVSGHPHPDQQVAPGDRQGVADRPASLHEQSGVVRSPRRGCGHGAHDPASVSFWPSVVPGSPALGPRLSAAAAPRLRPRRRLVLASCSSSSAACPVRARNTSSRDGRRSARPLVWTDAASRPRTASISASEPRPPTPTVTTPVSLSACGSLSPTRRRQRSRRRRGCGRGP